MEFDSLEDWRDHALASSQGLRGIASGLRTRAGLWNLLLSGIDGIMHWLLLTDEMKLPYRSRMCLEIPPPGLDIFGDMRQGIFGAACWTYGSTDPASDTD